MPIKKIALVHDYLAEYGGAERVLEVLHQIYPEAPVYVAFFDKKRLGLHTEKFVNWHIQETFLAKIPLIGKIFSPLRIFAAKAFTRLDLSTYDLVISSSNAYMAKAVKVPRGIHICYCHTPPRALYGYTTGFDWKKNPVTAFFGELINHYMRIVDQEVSARVDYFIANSEETKRRIKKFYRRESVVINPPVKVNRETALIDLSKRDYYLYVNRLGLAKHPELAVQLANKFHFKLKIVGVGKMLPKLQAIAKDNIEFLGAVDDQDLAKLYQNARALLYPVEDEDFGMIPVEAMSYGVPVIAHESGGPRETIIDGKTGVFFRELTIASFGEAYKQALKTNFNPQFIQKHSWQYSEQEFIKKMTTYLANLVKNN